jgi:hypothetical protein
MTYESIRILNAGPEKKWFRSCGPNDTHSKGWNWRSDGTQFIVCRNSDCVRPLIELWAALHNGTQSIDLWSL